jgi:hypothetical protein
MFLTHQTEIEAFASQSADNCFKVLRFVQLTIQQRFSQLPKMTEEIVSTGDCKRLSQRQRDAIETYSERREEIFQVIFGSLSIVDKLLYVSSLPGFGLIKAGFVLQCTIGAVGCFDVHNCRVYAIKASAFALTGSSENRARKAQKYLELCESIGTAKLWNDWCELVAEKYPNDFSSASHVSRLHVDCIKA